LGDPISKHSSQKRAGGVAQGEGPEFKPVPKKIYIYGNPSSSPGYTANRNVNVCTKNNCIMLRATLFVIAGYSSNVGS
jgi:hypothetical protein